MELERIAADMGAASVIGERDGSGTERVLDP